MNLSEFSQKTLNLNGCTIHYWIKKNPGIRPWLIILHGAGADHRMFYPQLPIIKSHFNVLLWDARGHGISKPSGDNISFKTIIEDLLKLLDTEEIGKATFIGQSMGGNIAQEIAFYYPEKVEALVLIDCTCNTNRLKRSERFLVNLTPFLLPFYPWDYMVRQSAKVSSIKPEVRGYLEEVFNTIGKKDFYAVFLSMAGCLHYEKDYIFGKPMLLVCGDRDKTGNIKKIAPEWAAREPKCEFHVIKNASHGSNIDNPNDFNALLGGFLDRLYPNNNC